MTKARTLESRSNVFTPFTGCAQIYHQRWYVRSPRGNVKGVLIVRVGGVLEIGVPGDVILIRQKRADTTQLEDTFSRRP